MRTSAVLAGLLFLSGCIIGTWPTPEMRDDTSAPSQQATAEDVCDGVDNDADGVVDEGCACQSGDERGCVGITAEQCGLGVQHCEGGLWGGCTNIGPPYSAPQSGGVTIVDVDPAALTRGGSEVITVRATASAACPGIQVARVEASLASQTPAVRVWALALDDGVAPDALAGDGEHTASLVNAFGPGVAAQALILEVSATIQGRQVVDSVVVPLEEP
jgi:hypothetical protein